MPEQRHQALCERYHIVRERLAEAARAAGRGVDEVELVAVSKFHDAEAIRTLIACGHRAFGESYAQEALAKQQLLAGQAIDWHYVGRVQTNKAKDVAGHFCLIHAVDSLRLAEALARRLPEGAAPQAVLIQVNVGQEAQKAGVDAANLPQLAEQMLALPRLALRGLMCLPPAVEGDEARPFFAALRELRDALAVRLGSPLPCLSMGMSGDFTQAVGEGSTMVRIGTDIFGPRTA